MPNEGTKAKINGKSIPGYEASSRSTIVIKELFDDSLFAPERESSYSVKLVAPVEDEDDQQTFRELFGNNSYSVIDLASSYDDKLSGLYQLTNGDIRQGSEEWSELRLSIDGKYSFYNWIVDGKEIETDWDVLCDVTFSNSDSGNEDSHTSLQDEDGNDWHCLLGDWTANSGYLYCDNDSGINHCVLNKPYLSDVIVEAELYGDTGDKPALSVRMINKGSGTYGYGYSMYINIGSGTISFHRWDDSDNVLQTFVGYSWTSATYYEAKLIARGNRFDCFVEDDNDALRYVGTVYDDKYPVGYAGVSNRGSGIDGRAKNIKISYAKPNAINLPIGSHTINQIVMPTTGKLNDNIVSTGYSKQVIAPQNPVKFKQSDSSILNLCYRPMLYVNAANTSNGVLYDSSGNDIDGTLDSDDQIVDEIYNNRKIKCITNTYGADSSISFGTPDALAEDREISLEFFFKADIIDLQETNNYLFHKDQWRIAIRTDSSNKLGFYNKVAGAWYESDSSIVEGEWYHCVVTYSAINSRCKWYINNVLDNSVVASNAGVGANSTDTFRIFYTTAYKNDIKISFFRYYDTLIDDTVVDMLYNTINVNDPQPAEVKVWDTKGYDGDWNFLKVYLKFDEGTGTAVYDSGRLNTTITETNVGGTEWDDSSYNKWAKSSFHATGNEILQFNPNDLFDWNSGVTAGIWFNFDNRPGSDEYIFSYYSSDGGTNSRFYLYVDGGTDNLYWQLGSESAVDTGFDVTYGDWYFAVMVYDGANAYLYINGALEDTWSSPSGLTKVDNTVGFSALGHASASCIDGYVDDFFLYSRAIDSDRVEWLYNNMPNLVNESNWQRVYDPDHEFIGDMIIDNGIIRYTQFYREIDGSTSYWDKTMPYLYCYSDGKWEDSYRLWGQQLYDSETNSTITKHTPFQLKCIEKYRVIVNSTVYETSNAYANYDAIITQNPFIIKKYNKWELRDPYFYYNTRCRSENGDKFGFDQAPRFACVSIDNIDDSVIATASTTGSEEEGLSISFSTRQNILLLATSQSNRTWLATYDYGDDTINNPFRWDTHLDTSAEEPPFYMAVGMMPFDVSELVQSGEASNWTGEDATNTEWANLGATVRITTDGSGSMYCEADLKNGAYRAFYLLMSDAGTADALLFTREGGTGNYSADFYHSNISASGEWCSVDFIVDYEGTTTRLYVQDDGTDGSWINCGEIVIVPISNGKNYPLDYKNQALRQTEISEGVSD